jgi:hypothetical protein
MREGFSYDYRIPFEALYQPAYYLGKQNGILDTEPHHSAALPPLNGGSTNADRGAAQKDSRVSFEQCNDSTNPEYQMAMNNFLATIPSFFLKDSRLKSFISKPANMWDQFDSTSVYRMYVVLSKGSIANPDGLEMLGNGYNPYQYGAWVDGVKQSTFTLGSSGGKVNRETPFQQLENGGQYGNTIRMYDRFGPNRATPMATVNSSVNSESGKYDFYGSSFGPPVAVSSSYSGSAIGYTTSASFAPYTPPYFHGQAVAVIDYFPPGTGEQLDVYTVPEIFNDPHLRVTYLRECEAPFMTHEWGNNIWELTLGDANKSMAVRNAMQISSSVNLFGQVLNYKKTLYDQLGNISGYEEVENPKDVTSWVIETKFECPVLHFDTEYDSDISLPISGSGSVAAGMWHQYSTDDGARTLTEAEKLNPVLLGDATYLASKQRQIQLSIVSGEAFMPPNTMAESSDDPQGVPINGLPSGLRAGMYTNPHTGLEVTHIKDLANHIGMGKNKKLLPDEIQKLEEIFSDISKYKNIVNTGGASVFGNPDPGTGQGSFESAEDAVKFAIKQLQQLIPSADTMVDDLVKLDPLNDWNQKIGEVAENKVIREAVLAIPFTVTKEGEMQRYTFPQQWVEYALTGDLEALPGAEGVNWEEGGKIIPSQTVVNQVRAMNKYVLPPHLDFINNNTTPCVMYVFEFEHTLNKNDLINIWQNLPPKSLMDVAEPLDTVSSIDHPLFINDFFGVSNGAKTFNFPKTDVRWQIFKVKQRSPNFYPDMTLDQTDNLLPDVNIINEISSDAANLLGLNPQIKAKSFKPVKAGMVGVSSYGYNWPYDFFTMLELARLEGGVSMTPGQRPVSNYTDYTFDIEDPDFGFPADPPDPVPELPPESVRDMSRYDERSSNRERTTISVDSETGDVIVGKEAPPRGLRSEVVNNPLGDPVPMARVNDPLRVAMMNERQASSGVPKRQLKEMDSKLGPGAGPAAQEGGRKQDLKMFDHYGPDESGKKQTDRAGNDGSSGLDKQSPLSAADHKGGAEITSEDNKTLDSDGKAISLIGPGIGGFNLDNDPDIA